MDETSEEFKRLIDQYEEGFLTREEFVAKMLDEAAIQHRRLEDSRAEV